jgi:membrane-bound metal-dependent hydrolase YbcI (DUF457 family)
VISTRVVNSPLETRRERGLVSRLLFTFWPGGFAGSYFYHLYYLISLKHHKVKIFQRYRVCYFNISRWTRNKGHHRIWQIFFISRYFTEYWLQWQTDNFTIWQMWWFWLCNCQLSFFCSNIPFSPAYGVYISQLIRYARTCFAYEDFSKRGKLLTKKLMLQGYNESRLKSSFCKFYGRYNDLVCDYKLSLAHMLNDLFHTIC